MEDVDEYKDWGSMQGLVALSCCILNILIRDNPGHEYKAFPQSPRDNDMTSSIC